MGDAGLIVVCAFISPFRADRQMAREIAGSHEFIEVFVDTPIGECIRRDPKGALRQGPGRRDPEFHRHRFRPTSRPENPEIRLETLDADPDALADRVLAELRRRAVLA